MTPLLYLALALGFTVGALVGIARLLWEALREGYARGYVRVVGEPATVYQEDEDE